MSNLRYVDFLSSSEEVAAMNFLNVQTFNYMVQKMALKPENVLFSFKDHICAVNFSTIHVHVYMLNLLQLFTYLSLTLMQTQLKPCLK